MTSAATYLEIEQSDNGGYILAIGERVMVATSFDGLVALIRAELCSVDPVKRDDEAALAEAWGVKARYWHDPGIYNPPPHDPRLVGDAEDHPNPRTSPYPAYERGK